MIVSLPVPLNTAVSPAPHPGTPFGVQLVAVAQLPPVPGLAQVYFAGPPTTIVCVPPGAVGPPEIDGVTRKVKLAVVSAEAMTVFPMVAHGRSQVIKKYPVVPAMIVAPLTVKALELPEADGDASVATNEAPVIELELALYQSLKLLRSVVLV